MPSEVAAIASTLSRMIDPREAAWWAVHDALQRLPGWRVTPSSFHGEERPWPRWHVTAHDGRSHGRRARHEAVEGTGMTEIEALEMLAWRLAEAGRPQPR